MAPIVGYQPLSTYPLFNPFQWIFQILAYLLLGLSANRSLCLLVSLFSLPFRFIIYDLVKAPMLDTDESTVPPTVSPSTQDPVRARSPSVVSFGTRAVEYTRDLNPEGSSLLSGISFRHIYFHGF